MDIYQIPYNDIKLFLTVNNRDIASNQSSNYETVSIMLNNHPTVTSPGSIADYQLALHLQKSSIELPQINLSYINQTPPEELNYLTEHLQLPNHNKDRIIRI